MTNFQFSPKQLFVFEVCFRQHEIFTTHVDIFTKKIVIQSLERSKNIMRKNDKISLKFFFNHEYFANEVILMKLNFITANLFSKYNEAFFGSFDKIFRKLEIQIGNLGNCSDILCLQKL